MTDRQELKRLAEACGDLNWRAIQENWCERAIRDDHAYIANMRTKSAKHPGPCPDREAKARFLCAVTPAAIRALISENERLRMQLVACGVVASSNTRETAERQRDMHPDYMSASCQEVIHAVDREMDLREERDKLKSENDVLRDDIEQSQYDANAWRNSEESVWIEVFNSEGDDPFISAISGQIGIEQLGLIQAQLIEYRDDYFEKGAGLYVFRCSHYQAHYDNVGMTEPAHWETDFESHSPFPWEEGAEVMGEGDRP